jgi:hypothetical protein
MQGMSSLRIRNGLIVKRYLSGVHDKVVGHYEQKAQEALNVPAEAVYTINIRIRNSGIMRWILTEFWITSGSINSKE